MVSTALGTKQGGLESRNQEVLNSEQLKQELGDGLQEEFQIPNKTTAPNENPVAKAIGGLPKEAIKRITISETDKKHP